MEFSLSNSDKAWMVEGSERAFLPSSILCNKVNLFISFGASSFIILLSYYFFCKLGSSASIYVEVSI